jgi:hypothetical protein
MVEQQLDRIRELGRRQLVDGIEHPCRFREDQVRNPGPPRHECLGRLGLARVVAYQQPHQYVGVNGAHGVA